MRKLLRNSLLVLLTLVASSAWADVISSREAREYAADYVEGGATRARMVKSFTEKENQPVYIFSRGVDKGFVVISGDDCLPKVLMYTEAGDYDEENMPQVLKDIIAHFANVVNRAQETGKNSPIHLLASTYDKNIAPLLTSWWGQGAPYNNLCPQRKDGGGHALTGCVATAGSQIAYYWRNECYKKSQYDTPTYSYGDAPVTESFPAGTEYHWELMKDNGGATAAGNKAMAMLNVILGTSSWLTYGSSTGGYIWNMANALQGQVGLTFEKCSIRTQGGGDYDTYWKRNYTQLKWEQLMIEDLKRGYPILYAGYTSDWAGHAFVMDGYRTKDNMFHINLGWGKSYDTYVTMIDGDDGVYGYGTDQSMIHGIHPLNSSRIFDVKLSADKIYSTVPVTIDFKVVNGSSNVMHGVYVFALSGTTSAPEPSNLEDAIFSYPNDLNMDDEVEGQVEWVDYSRSGYAKIYITDANLNILYQSDRLTINRSISQVELKGLVMENVSSSDKETVTVAGEEVELNVNKIKVDDFAYMTASVLNNTDPSAGTCTPARPQMRGILSKLQDGAFVELDTVINETLFDANEQKDVKFKYVGLEQNVLYKVKLFPTVGTYKRAGQFVEQEIVFDSPDSVLYFKLTGSSMKVMHEGSTVKFSGDFDPDTYNESLAQEELCIFDLTDLNGYDPEYQRPANKNALLVCNALQGVTGKNVIVDGECEELELLPGYNFDIPGKFTAKKAKYITNAEAKKLNTLVLPFTATTPDGMLASFRATATMFMSYQTELKAGNPYAYIACRSVEVTAEDVEVTLDGEYDGYDKFVPTYKNVMPEGKFLIPSKKDYSFVFVSDMPVKALTAYCSDTRVVETIAVTDVEISMDLLDSLVVAHELMDSLWLSRSVEANATFSTAIQVAENLFTTANARTKLRNGLKTFAAAMQAYRDEPETAVDVIVERKVMKNNVIYDVTGRVVKNMQDGGIYILNGKKYLK